MMRLFPVSSRRLAIPGLLLAASCAVMASPPALAQQTPTQVTPGAILQPEIQQGEPGGAGVPDRQKAIPEAPPEVQINVPEQKTGAAAGGGPSFQVNHITLEGNSIFTSDDFKSILAKYEGKEDTLDDLGKAVDEITKKYRDEGYLTTQAFVPPQDINNGEVKIQIVEGTVGQIDVSGNKYYKAWAIARDVGYEPGQVLNITDLESTLNRINRQQDFRLRAVLKAGNEPGETDLRFAVAERQPWQISPTFDNQGRDFVGLYRFGVELQNNNLTGLGDRLDARWVGAHGTQIASTSYTLPLNRYGTELSYSYAYSFVNVELPNRVTNNNQIKGYANNHTLMLSQPLDKDHVWSLDAAFNARRVTTSLHETNTNQDDVRSLTFGLNFDKLDKTGRTFVRLQTDVAPLWMEENRHTFFQENKEGVPFAVQTTVGGRQFWKASGFATRVQRMPWENNLLILRGAFQVSPDDLPSVEEMQIGGAFSVRGFSEGLLSGDRGYNFGVEYRMPLPGMKYVSPWVDQRLQLAGFYDMGQVWQDDSNPQLRATVNHSNYQHTLLIGAGAGLRWRFTRYMIGFVDFGFPITNQEHIETKGFPDVRVHFGLRSDLLPDNYEEHGTTATPVGKAAKKAALTGPIPQLADEGAAPASAAAQSTESFLSDSHQLADKVGE